MWLFGNKQEEKGTVTSLPFVSQVESGRPEV